METTVKGKRVVRLKEVFKGITHYYGGKENNLKLRSALIAENDKGAGGSKASSKTNIQHNLSNVILDICDVTITRPFEITLYAWIKDYLLRVVDSTGFYTEEELKGLPEEERIKKMNKATEKALLNEIDNNVRNEVLHRKYLHVIDISRSYDLIEFCDCEDELIGIYTFNREGVKRIVDLLNKRREEGNENKLMVTTRNFTKTHVPSIVELAGFLIKAVDFIDVIDPLTDVGRNCILPAVSQLCFDFRENNRVHAWYDIKRKFPTGSLLYMSRQPHEYLKCRVIENYYPDLEEGQEIDRIKYSLPKEEQKLLDQITVEYEVEKNVEVALQRYVIKRNYIVSHELIILPVAVIEGTVDAAGNEKYLVGMPSKEEFARNFNRYMENNEHLHLNRNGLNIDQSYSMFIGFEGNSADKNYIEVYREAVREEFKRQGITDIPKIDLVEIVRGEPSPYVGFNYSISQNLQGTTPIPKNDVE